MDLPAYRIPLTILRAISNELVQTTPRGNDYRLVGENLGIPRETMLVYENENNKPNQNGAFEMLKDWRQLPGSTILKLHNALQNAERDECCHILGQAIAAGFPASIHYFGPDGEVEHIENTDRNASGNKTLWAFMQPFCKDKGLTKADVQLLSDISWDSQLKSLMGLRVKVCHKDIKMTPMRHRSASEGSMIVPPDFKDMGQIHIQMNNISVQGNGNGPILKVYVLNDKEKSELRKSKYKRSLSQADQPSIDEITSDIPIRHWARHSWPERGKQSKNKLVNSSVVTSSEDFYSLTSQDFKVDRPYSGLHNVQTDEQPDLVSHDMNNEAPHGFYLPAPSDGGDEETSVMKRISSDIDESLKLTNSFCEGASTSSYISMSGNSYIKPDSQSSNSDLSQFSNRDPSSGHLYQNITSIESPSNMLPAEDDIGNSAKTIVRSLSNASTASRTSMGSVIKLPVSNDSEYSTLDIPGWYPELSPNEVDELLKSAKKSSKVKSGSYILHKVGNCRTNLAISVVHGDHTHHFAVHKSRRGSQQDKCNNYYLYKDEYRALNIHNLIEYYKETPIKLSTSTQSQNKKSCSVNGDPVKLKRPLSFKKRSK